MRSVPTHQSPAVSSRAIGCRSRRAAFTLIETVAATGIAGILLTGLASAVLVSLRANQMPDYVRNTLDASDVLADMADEARYAIYISERSDKLLQFTVPDMDEDGLDDVIRYEWSGTPGDPLERTFNFDSPITIVEDVQQFDLSYLLRSQDEQFTGLVDSSEVKFTEYAGDVAKTQRDVRFDQWLGQYFHPDDFTVTPLPANAVSWKVTKVTLENRESWPLWGRSWIQLREATGGKTPTSTIYQQRLLWEFTLSGWADRSYSFWNIPQMHRSQGMCLVVEWIGSGIPVSLRSDNAAGGALRSIDQGATFTYYSDQTLRYKVYGTYRTPGGTQTVTRKFVTGVRGSVQIGTSSRAALHTNVPLINMPESLGRFWKLDFDVDPTMTDADFDDTGDWVVRGGTSFDTNRLKTGVWDADESVLDTVPDCDFSELTTAIVRMRNTSIGGEGAVFEISADHAGAKRVRLKISVALQPDGTQTLTAWKKIDDVTWVTLDQVAGLSPAFVEVRMLIDPDTDTVAISYDGVELGAYDYLTFDEGTADRFATIYEDVSDAEFDFVSIRVSDP